MKKLLLLLIPILLGGCKKNFNNVVDSQPVGYQVVGITTPDQFSYFSSDSLITINIKLNSSENVTEVTANVYDPDNNLLNDSPLQLFDNGNAGQYGDTANDDNVYSNKFPLSYYYPNGTYQIQYYITDIDGNTKLAAIHSFQYDNNQINIAPVISDLIMPDSVSIGVSFTFSVVASDSNGLNDLASVYFQAYKPDGTQVKDQNGSTYFFMQDNGNMQYFGDTKAGDGIYSYKNSFASDAPAGTWKFEFQAKDRRGLLSNKITHNIVVK
jgi:hypothetical protein